MSGFVEGVIGFTGGAALLFVITYTAVNAAWVNECKKLGVHLHEGVVYECKVKA